MLLSPVLYFLFWLRKKLWEKKSEREGVGHDVTVDHRLLSRTATCHFCALFILVEFNYKENRCLGFEEGRFVIFKIIILLGKKERRRGGCMEKSMRCNLFKSFAFFLCLLNDIDLRQTL